MIAPPFAGADRFSGGQAAVRTAKTTREPNARDAWGYINKSGKLIVKPLYNEARPFKDGKASVHEGGSLRMLEDALFEWKGGRWLEIDATGKVLRVVSE